jgi:acetyl esterase
MADLFVHPKARAMIELAARSTEPPLETLSPVNARAIADPRVVQAPLRRQDVAQVSDIAIPGPAGPLTVRLYRPTKTADQRVCMFFHGGGFMLGNLETHDALCRALACQSGAAVVAVDFRLAPEHKFPAATSDCLAATRWVLQQARSLGLSARRFAVAGESSGGNLAASVGLQLRAYGLTPSLQVLLYPLVDMELGGPSYHSFADGFLLTARRTEHYINNYLRSPEDKANPFASPLRDPTPSLSPSTFLLTAGLDLSSSSAQQYGDRLRSFGVSVESVHFDGWPHGFLFWGDEDGSTKAIDAAGIALRRALCSASGDPDGLA